MSITFDAKFEIWLNEQLESIKSLSGFRRNRLQQQQQQQQVQREQSQLQLGTASASYQGIIGRNDTGFLARHQNCSTPFAMSRAGRDANNGGKHGGNYYRFAYDEDDVQSFEDVDDDNDADDDEEQQRRRRLSRMFGDQNIDFGSEAGLEMEDEFATTAPELDENRNSLANGGKMTDPRANQYSTTSLEFSDAESFVSATGSDATGSVTPARNSGDWSVDDGGDHDGYGGGGLDGFVEFSRVRDENGNGHEPDNEDDDPLRYGVKQQIKSGNQGLLSSGLIAAISGRSRSEKRPATVDSSKLPATKETGNARRMDDLVAVRFHKTDTGTSDADPPGGDYMDDDDILVHPDKHQLPVRDTRDVTTASSGKMASARGDGYSSVSRGLLPADYTMDIMSNDDGFSAGDLDDVSDVSGLHAKDRDPIFRGSKRQTSSSPSSPLQLARTLSNAASGSAVGCGGKRRRWLIAGTVVGVVLLGVGIAVAIFLIIR